MIVPASYDEYTVLVKSGNIVSKRVGKAVNDTYYSWEPGYSDLLSYVTFLLVMWWLVLNFFPSVRVNWCSYVDVVIFSNSFVINSLSGFSVPFSVISALRSAELMCRLIVKDFDTLYAHSAGLES